MKKRKVQNLRSEGCNFPIIGPRNERQGERNNPANGNRMIVDATDIEAEMCPGRLPRSELASVQRLVTQAEAKDAQYPRGLALDRVCVGHRFQKSRGRDGHNAVGQAEMSQI